nr:putative tricorn protease homolog 2 [Nerophis lumbriciformis]
MNLWSMATDGSGLRQHTRHTGWDVRWPTVDGDQVVYQLGADLWLHDLAKGSEQRLEIQLASDFDQQRERWIREPLEYLSAAHLSPDGKRVVLTARGQIFVVPHRDGRLVELDRRSGVRYRSARFLDDDSLIALSDESGEVEWWRFGARGVAAPKQLTQNGRTLRFDGLPSPDGRHLAYYDQDDELWLLDLASDDDSSPAQTRISSSLYFGFGDLAFSPDGSWLAYVVPADNFFNQIRLYEISTGRDVALTSDRFNSDSPAWSPDGRWLYFFSDRHLESVTWNPWGPYAPQPFLDRRTRLFAVSLQAGGRSPFAPPTELMPSSTDDQKADDKPDAHPRMKPADTIRIDLDGLAGRLWEVPIEPGNYRRLAVAERRLFWLARDAHEEGSRLQSIPIQRHDPKPQKFLDRLIDYELSADGKKLLLRRQKGLWVVPAKAKPPEKLAEHRLELGGWSFALDPREEWRQMYVDAWRLMRDYFYDPGMHGVDWPAMRDKYLPLVDRVADRRELSAVLGEMVGELSALHHFVRPGDPREGDDEDILPASLGALLESTPEGLRVERLYDGDPDLPEELSPLSRPGVEVGVGELIVSVNSLPTATVAEIGELLRRQAGRQVLLGVRATPSAELRQVIVEPLAPRSAARLRYAHWEYQRRLRVEELGGGQIGYVHLRAMGGRNFTEWARHYFPVAQRQGLVIDVRRNRGGNIDSWILGSLLRRPWMWWQSRTGKPYPNMQWSFNGHLVVLVDERTASDGEAFAEGFRRLGLGSVVGTRTWGGEIWLTSSNILVDRGIASAAEFGVYGPEGEWLIEGHGVEPDLVVDNLPHATWMGDDAQLEAAVAHLLEKIEQQPPRVPPVPPFPDKSVPGNSVPDKP